MEENGFKIIIFIFSIYLKFIELLSRIEEILILFPNSNCEKELFADYKFFCKFIIKASIYASILVNDIRKTL
jgi:hypothetical protein